MLENYKCYLLHKIAVHFIIPGDFSLGVCICSGNYSDFAKNTVQTLARFHLKFSLFQSV